MCIHKNCNAKATHGVLCKEHFDFKNRVKCGRIFCNELREPESALCKKHKEQRKIRDKKYYQEIVKPRRIENARRKQMPAM